MNTRCLYAKLFSSNYPLSNLTLCPLLDFANHTASSSVPQLTVEGFTKINHGSSGDSESEDDEPELDEFVVKLPNQLVAKGEEIFLRYGGHSNRMLFTEYGFVDDSVEPEVDVAELVDELVNRKFAGLTMKDLMPLDKHHFLSYVLSLLIFSQDNVILICTSLVIYGCMLSLFQPSLHGAFYAHSVWLISRFPLDTNQVRRMKITS